MSLSPTSADILRRQRVALDGASASSLDADVPVERPGLRGFTLCRWWYRARAISTGITEDELVAMITHL
jgi:hypothetical protein